MRRPWRNVNLISAVHFSLSVRSTQPSHLRRRDVHIILLEPKRLEVWTSPSIGHRSLALVVDVSIREGELGAQGQGLVPEALVDDIRWPEPERRTPLRPRSRTRSTLRVWSWAGQLLHRFGWISTPPLRDGDQVDGGSNGWWASHCRRSRATAQQWPPTIATKTRFQPWPPATTT